MKTNAIDGKDTIYVPAGTYRFTITGSGEDEARTGDLDITDDVDIFGAGAGVTIIDANDLDRVFHIHPTTASGDPIVKIHDVTIRGGNLQYANLQVGAGVMNNGASVHLIDCVVEDNAGSGQYSSGGGVFSKGHPSGSFWGILHVTRTTIRGNSAGTGGGILADHTLLFISWSTVSENSAVRATAGAVYCQDSVASVNNSTFALNTNVSESAFANINSSTTVRSSTFSNSPANLWAENAEDEIILSNTIIDGPCTGEYFTTLGGNIGGPDNSCFLVNPGDYHGIPVSLMPLGDYGGPTETMPPTGITALLAVDNPWANANCLDDDQRGLPRPMDGDGDGTADCDSGAVEMNSIFVDGFESGDTTAWSNSVN